MSNDELLRTVTERAQNWLTPQYDEETREEVKKMLDAEDKTELIESFYKDLEFGTGGLRGIMGAGTNRMNRYTVGAATQGLANYLKDCFKDLPQIAVAVGHDVRHNSRKFAELTADIFSANGIKVYLFDGPCPTPEVSYAIRKLGCQSGVMVTASHNPKEYNGYKAYWSDGAQMIAPHDVKTIEYVNAITSVDQIKFTPAKELIQIVGKDIDEMYLDDIHSLSLDPEADKRHSDMKIVYTPIHGTGTRLMFDSLKRWGFENVIHVPEQDVQSGDFPTVVSPNPENPEAMAMGVAKAKEVGASIVLASDPDADRIGLVVRDKQGEYQLVNGNQLVMLLLYYIITQNVEKKLLNGNEYCVKTIVTTETVKRIADANGIKCFDCYTGFKWIADVMRNMETTGRYIGGGEESYGFLAETFVRDKDSISANSLIAEAAAWAADKGMNLYELLVDIYATYGFSRERGVSVVRPGKSGAEEIVAMMKNFRENPPKELAGSPVTAIKDYSDLNCRNLKTGEVTKLDFPTTSNVLQFFTEAGDKVSIRPSGTEPKIKFYVEVREDMKSKDEYEAIVKKAEEHIDQVLRDLNVM
ncbi:MAG: phospho-sugar mutase [Muribaculaceae bacterium]|jgi:phosphoglucomutase|uniref:phospho-sugar mutase n=1 Tax=Bacteroidales TaxID=171549 RepID=UPI000F51AD82|nr:MULTISPECIES: phospho-sugar mutase [Bacteroidales]MBJ2196664.1 phospho-sugar mutase [Muribaculaceae bacterium]MCI9029350.1 phospho-sugar mutase [Muribaculaceae bacterium]MCX4280689.1 phospho-sugar mutase [Muribaculaceae bacterium]ROS84118.1 phospho-sugar mutase [Muribaculaceae bacterium Isolate-036 (Harlan)]